MDISQVLVQFIFRLSFGFAFAMGITSPRWVASGFYRIHLWVLLGLNTLAALVMFSRRDETDYGSTIIALAIVAAVTSYVGSVVWLYEKASLGRALVWVVSLVSLAAAMLVQWRSGAAAIPTALAAGDVISSGLLLGLTLASMLLGHWYLNSQSMRLEPLKRLLVMVMGATLIRSLINGLGLALEVSAAENLVKSFWIFVALRWMSGLFLALPLVLLAWQTLKIPNTQSATGILYAAVVVVFIGELTSQLLYVQAIFPL